MSMRNGELNKLEIFIGKWMNHGRVITTGEEILTSDVYEWLPGKQFVLHTAYGQVGTHDVGGVELIGYNAKTRKLTSHFFTDQGDIRESELSFDGAMSCTWHGQLTGCTAEFAEAGKLQTAHHIRLDEHGNLGTSVNL